jgi:hypothetical protein
MSDKESSDGPEGGNARDEMSSAIAEPSVSEIASDAIVSIPSCGVVDCGPSIGGSADVVEEVGDEHSAKLDALGPIILNTDGTMGRISNWTQFTETERAQALRLVAARNKKRKEALLRERSTSATGEEGK